VLLELDGLVNEGFRLNFFWTLVTEPNLEVAPSTT
jgi:hypothetical protein